VANKSIVDIAKTAVPAHLQATARLVVHSESPPRLALTTTRGALRATTVSTDSIADKLSAKLGVKPKPKRAGKSGDVEFTEITPLGKRSIVVQVRGGKVAQVIKRA
jgi:hypothetical protein